MYVSCDILFRGIVYLLATRSYLLSTAPLFSGLVWRNYRSPQITISTLPRSLTRDILPRPLPFDSKHRDNSFTVHHKGKGKQTCRKSPAVLTEHWVGWGGGELMGCVSLDATDSSKQYRKIGRIREESVSWHRLENTENIPLPLGNVRLS